MGDGIENIRVMMGLDTDGERVLCCRNPTIKSCCGVSEIVGHVGIVARYGRLEIGGGKIAFVSEHSTGNVVRKLFDLFSYVFEEGVA